MRCVLASVCLRMAPPTAPGRKHARRPHSASRRPRRVLRGGWSRVQSCKVSSASAAASSRRQARRAKQRASGTAGAPATGTAQPAAPSCSASPPGPGSRGGAPRGGTPRRHVTTGAQPVLRAARPPCRRGRAAAPRPAVTRGGHAGAAHTGGLRVGGLRRRRRLTRGGIRCRLLRAWPAHVMLLRAATQQHGAAAPLCV
jgi:hypothetical protein